MSQDNARAIATGSQPAGVTRQIWPGFYKVRARKRTDETDVGVVFVEGNDTRMIEHWVLSEGHTSPNLDQDMVVVPSDEKFSSLNGFFTAMRERTRTWQKVTYIKAVCDYYDSIPEL